MRFFLLAMALTVSPFVLFAGTNNVTAVVLPSIVVEASRFDKTVAEMPYAVDVQSRSDIRESGARDVVALLGQQPGVAIRNLGAGNPALAHVAMRGFGENAFGRVLMVVDGERLNHPDMAAPSLARLAVGSIERLEILHGPQSVLYGDNAAAGVINITTDTSDDAQVTTMEAYGGSWGRYGAHLATRGSFTDDGVSYWAAMDWDRSDGYRANSGYEYWAARGGMRKTWKNGAFVRASVFYHDSRYALPGGLSWNECRQSPRHSTHREDWATLRSSGGRLSMKGIVAKDHTVQLSVTASHRVSDSHFHYPLDAWGTPPMDYNYGSDIYSYSFSPQYACTQPVFGFEQTLTAGADVRWDVLRGYNRTMYLPPGLYYPNTYEKPAYARLSAGIYAQEEFFLTDMWSITVGARLERLFAENQLATPRGRTDTVSAYDLAMLYRPVEGSKVFLRGSRFFRSAFLDEVPWGLNGVGVYARKGILAPERGWALDFGGEYRWKEAFTCSISLYAMTTEREIFYDALQYSNINSPWDVWRYGCDMRVAWDRKGVGGVSATYSYVDASFHEGPYDARTIPLVPMHTVALNGYVYIWDECSVFGGYRYVSEQVSCSDFANQYERLKAFGLFFVGARYAPKGGWLDGFSFRFTVENLFDKNYCDYSTYGSSYYPGAGRCFLISVGYEF